MTVTPPKIPSKTVQVPADSTAGTPVASPTVELKTSPSETYANSVFYPSAQTFEEDPIVGEKSERQSIGQVVVEKGKITVQLILNYLYTAGVSLAFVALLAVCIYLLNGLDRYASTSEGSVMPLGIKLWQYVLWTLGIHSGSVVVAKFVDWTSSSGESYYYENPLLVKNHQDLRSDLRNPNDSGARLRLRWHSRRFYTFYFVSVGICVLLLALNKLAGLN